MAQNRSRKQVRELRTLGLALTPRAVRYSEKCPYDPGEHGRSHHYREPGYVVRLEEKQHLHAQYGIHESQLRRVFEEARRIAGLTGENLAEFLGMRLDALVLRVGFAHTIQQAHQFVVHCRILVDGEIVDRPSFHVKPDQIIQVEPKSQTAVPFEIAAQGIHHDILLAISDYLDVELERPKTILVRHLKHAEVPVTCDIQMVVEHYSR